MKFFHSYANAKRRKNLISGVNNLAGVWEERPNLVANLFIDYFKKTLFF